ncbi:MAG TPA: DUF1254 domain-containing protein [Candidatus Krumholzibacteria bacterium]|nr:DUF1254 domain-containing protein [Candidatus Krumholzibacteria bacterium]
MTVALAACVKKPQAPELTADEARAIATDAYVYGFPLVDSYRVQYTYFVDAHNPEFRGDWNTMHCSARVLTPNDKTVQTPNSDTPYCMVGADLRTEPLVLTVPDIDPKRYYSIQFIDMYTHNFAYVGSRTTGNGGANYLLTGPGWTGETPAGIKQVIRCETQFAMLICRTQLFNPGDIDNVKKIQDGYRIHPLSQFLGQPAPAAAPQIDFIAPLSVDDQKTSPDFFKILNFVLQFCPTDSSETALMTRFAKLHIGAGQTFDMAAFKPDIQQAISDGMKDAWDLFHHIAQQMSAGKITAGDMFGTRQQLQNKYALRMAAAVTGIYGNSKEEAMYPIYRTDASGADLNGANKYVLHFGKDQLPPVNAFWSVTMYELPASLLYDNALDRYLINSPMLPKLRRDKDGGLTIYIQHASPGPKLQSNWLPAPAGPFAVAMRLYWPKPEALDGTWTAPPLQKAQ